MSVVVKWVDNVNFIAESGSGHTVRMDGAPDAGGKNLGARPMEMVLTGLGGCSSFDVVTMLRDAGQDIRHVELQIEAERADTIPSVFTHIHGHFVVSGRALNENEVQKAVKLSAERYSSVSKMLEKAAVITYDYSIVELA